MPPILGDNLGYFFHDRPHATSDRVALIDLWGERERTLSYRLLDERMGKFASLLRTLGCTPGDRLGVLIGNRSEYVEVLFGAMRAGLVPVPLNTKQPASMLKFMICDAGCTAAIVDADAVPDAFPLIDGMDLACRIALVAAPADWTDYESGLARAPSDFAPAISPDGIAFQPYTAGSTGRPKGVRLTHRGMLWSIRSTQQNWPTGASEVGLVAVPLFHKNAMRGTIKPVLYAGAKAVLMPRFEPRAFLDALMRYDVTFAGGVPAIFAMLLQHRDLIARMNFGKLKAFSLGSAIVPPEMTDALELAFKGVKIKESYGLTEAGGPLREPAGGGKVPRGSCGVASDGYEVTLVADGRHGVNEGELWTRNPCVTDGYHNLPEVTREKIVDGWLRTGDIFRVDSDGFYYFMGRIDDMFSCGGENVYPKEVESLLCTHPAVREACVAPITHQVKGLAPGAAVVLHDGLRATPEELKTFCLKHGPAYAHPRVILILDDLPLSGAGKPDRKAVQQCLVSASDAG